MYVCICMNTRMVMIGGPLPLGHDTADNVKISWSPFGCHRRHVLYRTIEMYDTTRFKKHMYENNIVSRQDQFLPHPQSYLKK